MKKGQLISADFVPALIIFIGIFVGILISWNSTVNQIDDVREANDMRRTALMASDSLVRGDGIPSNWTNDSVSIMGLSDGEPNVLNEDKVGELLSVSYADAKTLMGIRDDFYMELNRTTGSVFTIDGEDATYGTQPAGADDVVIVKRFFLLNEERGMMTFKVWK